MVKSDALNVLGLCGSPSMDEIKKAYFLMSKRYHPDINQDNPEKFKEISEAYNALKSYFTDEYEEKQSFSVQNPHFNSYDGKLNEEDIEAFQKNKKENVGFHKINEKEMDSKGFEEKIYKEIFGKSFQEDPEFFYEESNREKREKFENIMEKNIQKKQGNLNHKASGERFHNHHKQEYKKRFDKMLKH